MSVVPPLHLRHPKVVKRLERPQGHLDAGIVEQERSCVAAVDQVEELSRHL